MTDELPPLETREGLPDALRVLLEDFPREAWAQDPNFSALIRFWLERHLMFRRLTAMLTDATEKALDGEIEARQYAANLSRLGSTFVQELHGHHMIEDAHYFPVLKDLDTRLERGFDILDRDHHAIDGHLEAFVGSANAALQGLSTGSTAEKDAIAPMKPAIARLNGFLDRHLIDEEELVVPVLLKYNPPGLS